MLKLRDCWELPTEPSAISDAKGGTVVPPSNFHSLTTYCPYTKPLSGHRPRPCACAQAKSQPSTTNPDHHPFHPANPHVTFGCCHHPRAAMYSERQPLCPPYKPTHQRGCRNAVHRQPPTDAAIKSYIWTQPSLVTFGCWRPRAAMYSERQPLCPPYKPTHQRGCRNAVHRQPPTDAATTKVTLGRSQNQPPTILQPSSNHPATNLQPPMRRTPKSR